MQINIKKAFCIHRKIRNKNIDLPDIMIISKDLNVWSCRFHIKIVKRSIEKYSYDEIIKECRQFLYLPKQYVSYDYKLKSDAMEAAYASYETFISRYL